MFALISLQNYRHFARSNVHRMNVCDVSWFDKFSKKAVKPGGQYCVAGAPNKESCKNSSYAPGISMHTLPAEPKVKAKWVKFVQKHCIDFDKPVSRYAALCSAHFEKHCFQNDIAWSIGFVKRRDLIGGSIPTRDTIIPDRKLQVNEYFDVLAFLYKIHRISDVSCIN